MGIAAMEFYIVPHAEATVSFSNNCNCKIWNLCTRENYTENISFQFQDCTSLKVIGSFTIKAGVKKTTSTLYPNAALHVT